MNRKCYDKRRIACITNDCSKCFSIALFSAVSIAYGFTSHLKVIGIRCAREMDSLERNKGINGFCRKWKNKTSILERPIKWNIHCVTCKVCYFQIEPLPHPPSKKKAHRIHIKSNSWNPFSERVSYFVCWPFFHIFCSMEFLVITRSIILNNSTLKWINCRKCLVNGLH